MTTIREIIAELAPSYLAARKEELPRMLELLAASDFARLHILSHNLKGSGSSFGFPELTRFGAALELYSEQSDAVSFGEELNKLKDYLEHLPK